MACASWAVQGTGPLLSGLNSLAVVGCPLLASFLSLSTAWPWMILSRAQCTSRSTTVDADPAESMPVSSCLGSACREPAKRAQSLLW